MGSFGIPPVYNNASLLSAPVAPPPPPPTGPLGTPKSASQKYNANGEPVDEFDHVIGPPGKPIPPPTPTISPATGTGAKDPSVFGPDKFHSQEGDPGGSVFAKQAMNSMSPVAGASPFAHTQIPAAPAIPGRQRSGLRGAVGAIGDVFSSGVGAVKDAYGEIYSRQKAANQKKLEDNRVVSRALMGYDLPAGATLPAVDSPTGTRIPAGTPQAAIAASKAPPAVATNSPQETKTKTNVETNYGNMFPTSGETAPDNFVERLDRKVPTSVPTVTPAVTPAATTPKGELNYSIGKPDGKGGYTYGKMRDYAKGERSPELKTGAYVIPEETMDQKIDKQAKANLYAGLERQAKDPGGRDAEFADAQRWETFKESVKPQLRPEDLAADAEIEKQIKRVPTDIGLEMQAEPDPAKKVLIQQRGNEKIKQLRATQRTALNVAISRSGSSARFVPEDKPDIYAGLLPTGPG